MSTGIVVIVMFDIFIGIIAGRIAMTNRRHKRSP